MAGPGSTDRCAAASRQPPAGAADAGRPGLAVLAAVAIAAGRRGYNKSADPRATGPLPVHLPTTPESYLGVYTNSAPASYGGMTAFTSATGARPDVVMYYSGWFVPFPTAFATTAAANGAVPLVQMNPDPRSAWPGSRPGGTTAT